MQCSELLATKLYVPAIQPKLVSRPRLIERLNAGLWPRGRGGRKLTLVSASAGFGKTTLVSEWIQTLSNASPPRADPDRCAPSIAWFSLDQRDDDPIRFLTYLVAALQAAHVSGARREGLGSGLLRALQSPQPPPAEAVLTTLINEVAAQPSRMILVLDDYYLIEAQPIHEAVTFLLDHLPPQMHLVIATREDPPLPLARLRARGQMTELRAADLRFAHAEAAEFLNRVMGLNLSVEEIAALENRTEGWIAGLQLAAIALKGTGATQSDEGVAEFIRSFTGSHRFVLDYLLEEVLQRQPKRIQDFLLQTAILDRLNGPLCDAVRFGYTGLQESPGGVTDNDEVAGRAVLTYLERANLFVVPLDNERRWYRYHHLFADLLLQRLQQDDALLGEDGVTNLHRRASLWYEAHGLDLEAFHHAAAADDVDRAARLIEGEGIPLHLRGAVNAILDWLASLPRSVLDSRPSLWAKWASLLLVTGQTTGVEEKLQAAEAGLAGTDTDGDAEVRNLVGQIAAARATLALTRYELDAMIAQSRRALEYLRPDNLSFRAVAYWTLGNAYDLAGDRTAAARSLTKAISISQVSGDTFTTILATIGLGEVQRVENELHLAAETYQRVLQMAGDQPLQIVCEAYLGLARVFYEWNDLDGAEEYGQRSLRLAQQYDNVIDRFVICDVFLARLRLACGDVKGASAMIDEADRIARRHGFVLRMPEVAEVRVLVLLREGKPGAAARVAGEHDLPLSQARTHLALGEVGEALDLLSCLREQIEARGWQDERLKMMVLQAIALHADDDVDHALDVLGSALALAQPGGFVRTFVDEGLPMAHLLSEAAARGIMPGYTHELLASLEAEGMSGDAGSRPPLDQPLIEPLTPRELEILRLIAEGLSNREIAEGLFLALSTVKGHNRNLYAKLQVSRRTEAVARARELGLL